MSLEGLTAILTKEEVVVTRQSRDLLDRAKDVDDGYRWHVSTYVPMHKGIAAEGQLDVAAFARRLIQRVRDRRPALGYLTADFGYGKTSAGLYIWQQATDAGFVTIPPFQFNRLSDLIDAPYGWFNYVLSRSKPNLVAEAEQIYNRYTRQTLAKMSAQAGVSQTVLEEWVSSGLLTLDLTPDNIIRFFQEMTELALKAGFNGLIIIPDELQQYLEPKIKSGLSDPIAPLFNLVQTLAAQTDWPFGLLLIIPQKELNVIHDQRSDFLDRIRGLTLDLKAIYGREFPAQLWAKLAKVFEFESLAERIFEPETLEALGQISSRDDLANGPRTVINAFRAVIQRYLAGELSGSYSPVQLIDDFLNAVIVFDGSKRIQDSVLQALASNLVRNNPTLVPAVKLAAAFPVEGCSIELQTRYQLRQGFEELITSGLNELVISVGDRRKGGVTLRGLEVMRDESDWLTQTIRDFHRNFYEEAHNTLERAVQGFLSVLRHDIFKSNNWRVLDEQPASIMQNSSLTLEGTFPGISHRFPGRVVHVCVLGENEPVSDMVTSGEVTLEFRLKRYFDVAVNEQGKLAQALSLDETTGIASLTLNLLYQSDAPLHHRLENTIGRVVPDTKITPLFILALHDYLEKLRLDKRIPKIEEQLVQYEFQPELRRMALDELFNSTVGAQFGSVGVRVVEDIVTRLLEARYGDGYYTLMTVNTWSNNLRKYTAALRQLKTSFERQGHTLVRGTKDEIATYFGLANTGLDNYLANMADLIEVVEDFPTKRQIRVGIKGTVRFKQHPLEEIIQSWLDASEDWLERHGVRQPALPVKVISNRAGKLGYKEAEIEQIMALLTARDLVEISAGYLVRQPTMTYSVEEVVTRVETFQREVHFLQRLFPQTPGLNKLDIKAAEFAKQVSQLTKQPPESIFNFITELDEQTDWLAETRQGCLENLGRRVTAQTDHLPIFTGNHEAVLTEQVVGTSYMAQVNSIRLELLKEYHQLSHQHQKLAQQMDQIPIISEIAALSVEQLTQLVYDTDQRDKNLTELNRQIKQFEERVNRFKDWVSLTKQGANLLDRLQKAGTPARAILQQFLTLEYDIAQAFEVEPFEQLNKAHHFQAEFTRLHQALASIETQANNTFVDFQKGYQNALAQLIKIPRQKLWTPVIYSPLNPQAVHEQVYDYVENALLAAISDLDRETKTLKNNLRNVASSPALRFLEASRRSQVTDQVQDLEVQLENIYDVRELIEYAHDVKVVQDFQPPNAGAFYDLLQSIAAAQQLLQEFQQKFNTIQEPLQQLELSPAEEAIFNVISEFSHNDKTISDLIEIREKFTNLDELDFWQAVRSLWEKQMIHIYLESKDITLDFSRYRPEP